MCIISEQNQELVRLVDRLGAVWEPISRLRLLRRGAEGADLFLVAGITGPEKMSTSYNKMISMSESA
jgi:hypothetical protein